MIGGAIVRGIPVSPESVVVLSALHSQAARDHLTESLAGPQSIAPLPRVCAQLAELTAQQATDAAQLAKLIQSDPALAGEIMRVANSPALRPRAPWCRCSRPCPGSASPKCATSPWR